MADLELTHGKLKEAKLDAQQAIESMRPAQGAYQYLRGASSEHRYVLARGDALPACRTELQQWLALKQQVAAADLVAESQVELTVLSIEEFFFSSRRRHTRSKRDWSSDVCSSDLPRTTPPSPARRACSPRRRWRCGSRASAWTRCWRPRRRRTSTRARPRPAGGPRRTTQIGRASCRERA